MVDVLELEVGDGEAELVASDGSREVGVGLGGGVKVIVWPANLKLTMRL